MSSKSKYSVILDGFPVVVFAFIIVFGTILAGVVFGICNLKGVCVYSDSTDKNRVRVVFFGQDTELERGDHVLLNGKIEQISSISKKNNCEIAVISNLADDIFQNGKLATYKVFSEFRIAQIEIINKQENENSTGNVAECDQFFKNDDEIPTVYVEKSESGKRGSEYVVLDHNRIGIDKKVIKIETVLDPIIVKNEPQITRTINNLERYTDQLARYTNALARNEENTTKLIDKKIETTDAVTDLVRDSSAYLQTSKELIETIDPEDIKKIVNNIRHITSKFKTFVSKLNTKLDLVNRILKHIDPFEIPKFFKNIEKIRMTWVTQTQHVQEIKQDVEDISDDFNSFVQDFSRETNEIRQLIHVIKGKTKSIDDYAESLPEIDEKLATIIDLLLIPKPNGKPCCLEIDPDALNRLIKNLGDLSLEVEYYMHLFNKSFDRNGPELIGKLKSLIWKLDEFFGTGIDSLLQLEDAEGNFKKKHGK